MVGGLSLAENFDEFVLVIGGGGGRGFYTLPDPNLPGGLPKRSVDLSLRFREMHPDVVHLQRWEIFENRLIFQMEVHIPPFPEFDGTVAKHSPPVGVAVGTDHEEFRQGHEVRGSVLEGGPGHAPSVPRFQHLNCLGGLGGLFTNSMGLVQNHPSPLG